jgi:hypothetical protein
LSVKKDGKREDSGLDEVGIHQSRWSLCRSLLGRAQHHISA